MGIDLGMIAGKVIDAGMGMVLGSINDKRQIRQNDRILNQNIRANKEMVDYQKMKDLEMWKATGPTGMMEQLKEAGLNPGMIYGMSGAGGGTVGGSASVGGGGGPTGGREVQDMIGMGMQLALLKAQKENIEADTQEKRVRAENTAADTLNKPKQGANIDADTVNKTIQRILLEYGGKEAERQWNINKELSLHEYGAKADEYEAKSAVAAQVVKLHQDGTMQKLTEAELNNRLKDIGLKTEQIKGKELENAILKLEKEMQEKFGLDKNSPGLLKMIARLVLGYIK